MSIDFFILTALSEELKPILRYLIDRNISENGFELANVIDANNKKHSVLLYPTGCGQGTIMASIITTEAIIRYKPRIVLLIGVAAGFLENRVHKGDVIIPDTIDLYERAIKSSSKPRIKRRQSILPVSATNVTNLAKSISESPSDWYKEIKTKRPDKSEYKQPDIHAPSDGVLGSGNKNIEDPKAEERKYLISEYGKRALGFEMEAAGVALACKKFAVQYAVIKGVQDIGTHTSRGSTLKHRWRSYASDVAATLAIYVIKKIDFGDGTNKYTPFVEVKRLDPMKPEEIAASLYPLFDIDLTFPIQDRYGLKLLKLALKQPDAFWIARVDGQYAGYISIYRMINNNLYNSLKTQADQKNLELPDFNDQLLSEVDHRPQSEIPNSDRVYLYIDAIVVKYSYQNLQVGNKFISDFLIKEAISDLATIIAQKDTMATITISERIGSLIRRYWSELVPYGPPFHNIKGKEVYHQLYICE